MPCCKKEQVILVGLVCPSHRGFVDLSSTQMHITEAGKGAGKSRHERSLGGINSSLVVNVLDAEIDSRGAISTDRVVH